MKGEEVRRQEKRRTKFKWKGYDVICYNILAPYNKPNESFNK